ncbi:MAG: DUF3575 domain-containing protein [Bacteroidaceae bacterium]|nr:DUF3575 domain-containing protein [Bacteroidaceae bacterium]
MFKYLYLSIMLFFGSAVFAANDAESVKSDSIEIKDRLGFHTNALGWLLMTPNIGVEYDIVHTDYKKVSLLLHGRFNPATEQDMSSRYVYNVAGLKAEMRWYYRMRQRNEWEVDMVRSTKGLFNRLVAGKRLLTSRKNPRTYRAYYIGPYVGYDKFTLKYGSIGRQGTMFGAGVSFGYNIPLYIYNNGSGIDFELGASVGAVYLAYDKFGFNDEDHCYIDKGEHEGELFPYPVVSDLRMSLVYRMNPIRNQIKIYDSEILERDKMMYDLRMMYIDNYDNIYGLDEFPAGYNGKFAVAADVNADSEKYKRALKKYKDSIADNHKQIIAKLNREVKIKNDRIKEINRQIAEVAGDDSLYILDELRPAYNYIQMPNKLLSYGSDIMLPNDSATTIDDLDVKYLSELVSKYPYIQTETGAAESVEHRILGEHESLRQKLLNDNDTVSGILYFELLARAIPNVNIYSVKAHNDAYLFGKEVEQEKEDCLIRRVYLFQKEGEDKPTAAPLKFLENMDTIYVKKDTTATEVISSLNEEIEARNLVKIANAEKVYNIKLGKQKKVVEVEKISKADKKRLKAEEKARKKALAEAEKQMKAEEKARKKAEAKAAKENKESFDVPAVVPATEQPTEQATEEQQPAEEQPTEEQATEQQATEEQATEEQPTEEQATEEQPTEEQTAEEQATEEQPAEQPAEETEINENSTESEETNKE